MLLSLVAMIGCFIGAAKNEQEVCTKDREQCTDVPVKVFGSISGLLWLAVTVLIYKIPVTDPNENSDSEMVGIHARNSAAGGQHEVA